jgi:glycosyltransferase involved in cell wall biosynthesis
MSGITVVVTTFNDRDGLAELLPALAAQTRPPDELLVVDAGSTDGSAELAAAWEDRLPIRWEVRPGAGISAGRNIGIELAANERVACTDAGCRPQPQWLEAMAAALEDHDFVSGTYVVDPATPFEHAIAVALYPDVEEIGAGGLPKLWQKVFGRRFGVREATGRSMGFTRAAWRDGGGFPEDVQTGEDVAFASAVVDSGRPATLAPRATVIWRGRPTWRANWKMYESYAYGDAKLGRATRTAIRGAAMLAGSLLVFAGRRGRAAVAVDGAFYLSLPVARAARTGLGPQHWWRLPLVLALKDVAMLAGAVRGWREVNAPDDEPEAAA